MVNISGCDLLTFQVVYLTFEDKTAKFSLAKPRPIVHNTYYLYSEVIAFLIMRSSLTS